VSGYVLANLYPVCTLFTIMNEIRHAQNIQEFLLGNTPRGHRFHKLWITLNAIDWDPFLCVLHVVVTEFSSVFR